MFHFILFICLYSLGGKQDQQREGNIVCISRTYSRIFSGQMLETYICTLTKRTLKIFFRSVVYRETTNTYIVRGHSPLTYARSRYMIFKKRGRWSSSDTAKDGYVRETILK